MTALTTNRKAEESRYRRIISLVVGSNGSKEYKNGTYHYMKTDNENAPMKGKEPDLTALESNALF